MGAQIPHFSVHVYCGQMVAHLSYCWVLGHLVTVNFDPWLWPRRDQTNQHAKCLDHRSISSKVVVWARSETDRPTDTSWRSSIRCCRTTALEQSSYTCPSTWFVLVHLPPQSEKVFNCSRHQRLVTVVFGAVGLYKFPYLLTYLHRTDRCIWTTKW